MVFYLCILRLFVAIPAAVHILRREAYFFCLLRALCGKPNHKNALMSPVCCTIIPGVTTLLLVGSAAYTIVPGVQPAWRAAGTVHRVVLRSCST